MILISFSFIFSPLCCFSPITSLTDSSFQEFCGQSDAVIMFCNSTQTKCKLAFQLFRASARVYSRLDDLFRFGEVDCGKYPSLCKSHNATKFPTTRYYHKNGTRSTFTKLQELDVYLNWIANQSSIPQTNLSKELQVLTVDNIFDFVYDPTKNSLVAFVSDTCRYCADLKIHLAQANGAYLPEDNIQFALFEKDNWEEVSDKFHAFGVPQVILFPAASPGTECEIPPKYDENGTIYWKSKMILPNKCGVYSETYGGDRTSISFIRWLNQRIFSYRSVDGLIDEEAGIIDSLKEPMRKFYETFSETPIESYKSVKMSLHRIKIPSLHEYYIRVIEDVLERGQDWLEYEYDRLHSILETNNVNLERLEALTVRHNLMRMMLEDF
ncbi:putative Protein disulfide-isomerase [Blattamonas nauphoetae]|uniref:protein disulfide-isomerase n=1 Tax=Blattamonas nauphoetae TaxID=2049346 RepID=A0ABQ9XFH1_9EUKA|nr:putative Protein disulfide-isomerase [Blattamonas nauphoetae]